MGKDAKEVSEQIRKEMGEDAIIFSTEKIRQRGFFGLFKKPLVKIVAIDDSNDNEGSLIQLETKRELDELKKMVGEISNKLENLPATDTYSIKKAENSIFDVYVDYLTSKKIQAPIAKKIVEIVSRQINLSRDNFDHVVGAMRLVCEDYIGRGVTVEDDRTARPRIYVMLGPTGVGKTTTISKLAARLIVNRDTMVQKATLGLITLDTYRVGAINQLGGYAKIMDVPFEVAYDKKDLDNALLNMRELDYILIDTVGRGHKMAELREDFDLISSCVKNAQFFLLLNVSTDYNELKSIISSYSFLKDYRLIFTKLDEADNYANVLNIKVLTGKSLSYFTTGQSVPDDMMVADKNLIVNNLFSEEDGDGSS